MSHMQIFLAFLLALGLTCAQANKLYKWVDADGNIQYSDRIPPDAVKQAREELSTQGVTVKETPRALTREELEKQQELERLRAEQRQLIEKQRAEDRVLLRTFRSQDDIIMARDGKLAAVDVMIELTRSGIRRQQTKLAQLQQRAASLERSGKPLNEQINESIQTTINSINEGYASIDKREQDKQAIRDVFSRDLKRFEDLKNLAPKLEESPQKAYKDLDFLVGCDNKPACDAAWARAEEFVNAHANTPLQMFSERIIMTRPPIKDEDIGIVVSRLENKKTGNVVLFMDLYCKKTPVGQQLCASPKVKAIRASYRPWLEGRIESGSSQ